MKLLSGPVLTAPAGLSKSRTVEGTINPQGWCTLFTVKPS